MDTITLALPTVFVFGGLALLLLSVTALLARNAGYYSGLDEAKALARQMHSNGLKREITRLEGELSFQATLAQSAKCRLEYEVDAAHQRINKLQAQLSEQDLTQVEIARLVKSVRLMGWAIPLYDAIDSREGRHLMPCIQTILNLVHRLSPDTPLPQILPPAEPEPLMCPLLPFSTDRERAA
ncbi:hypothetical protein LX59_03026 [Azomonas agilis]|uniref:Uncharacterized protein n=1 Tax=Azomonas agilis TaxID=116849 RepID=A0A562HYW7_9GAMM|nr:hypothetical protein [Azomonas agilis]TWH63862.1 hypothetical protein LX59_03026 [Azomonas agilis]